MTEKVRRILTSIISSLAAVAIKKHDIKIMAIAGNHDTDLAKELIYTVLKEKMNVRRNTTDIWWDLSVPLNILGYEDKQRSMLGWIALISSSIFVLLTSSKNPHLLILEADAKNSHTIDYWTNVLNPKYFVILNKTTNTKLIDELVLKTASNEGRVLVPYKLIDEFEVFNTLKNGELFTFGKVQGADLFIKVIKDGVEISYEEEKLKLKKKLWWVYSTSITGSLFSVAVLEGIKLDEAAFSTLKFTFPSNMISKIKANLNLEDVNV